MCAMSMVFDYGRNNPPWQSIPTTPFPSDNSIEEALKKYLKLVEAAREYDEAAKQKDCVDPKKEEFMEEVLKRLAAIKKVGVK